MNAHNPQYVYGELLRRLSVAEYIAADLTLPFPLIEKARLDAVDALEAIREFEAHADRYAGRFLEKEER